MAAETVHLDSALDPPVEHKSLPQTPSRLRGKFPPFPPRSRRLWRLGCHPQHKPVGGIWKRKGKDRDIAICCN